jgi:predicted RNA-binding Zn ribbon-like protein
MLPDPGDRPQAPKPLRAVQIFVNTLDSENVIDELTTVEELGEALVRAGVLDPREQLGTRDLGPAIAVREGLRSLLLANNGVPAEASALAPLERAAEAARFTLAVADGSSARLVATARGIDGALGRLLAIVHEASLDGSLPRLKACSRDVCLWVFYDRSRNGSGKWCATSVCGNRTNTKAYRSRLAAPPGERHGAPGSVR